MSINTHFMPDEEIEAEARSLLAGYARKSGTVIAVPAVLLDDLLQHLGLQFEVYDLRKELKELRVAVFVVTTVREQMRYDTPRLVVEAGKPFEIILENTDFMPHNLVVVKPGKRERIGEMSADMTPDQLDRQGRSYVPRTSDILGGTKLLEPGQKESLKLTAPKIEGNYEYVCTYPGHWEMMWGTLVVTKDVDAYLQTNPAPTAGDPEAAAHHHHDHGK